MISFHRISTKTPARFCRSAFKVCSDSDKISAAIAPAPPKAHAIIHATCKFNNDGSPKPSPRQVVKIMCVFHITNPRSGRPGRTNYVRKEAFTHYFARSASLRLAEEGGIGPPPISRTACLQHDRFHHPLLAQTNRAVPPSAVFPAVIN
jgi:hypothetical protein